MVINLSDEHTDVLLQWKDIPAFSSSSATMFRYRDVTNGKGWEGYSSVGIGVRRVASHGNIVMIVSEMEGANIQSVEFADHFFG